MTIFDFDERLAPVRTGGFADAATSVAWLVGLLATVAHPAGVVVAGVLLGVTATSVSRAVAAGATFGVAVVALGWTATVLAGSPPISTEIPRFAADVPLLAVAVAALVAPAAVGGVVRFVG